MLNNLPYRIHQSVIAPYLHGSRTSSGRAHLHNTAKNIREQRDTKVPAAYEIHGSHFYPGISSRTHRRRESAIKETHAQLIDAMEKVKRERKQAKAQFKKDTTAIKHRIATARDEIQREIAQKEATIQTVYENALATRPSIDFLGIRAWQMRREAERTRRTELAKLHKESIASKTRRRQKAYRAYLKATKAGHKHADLVARHLHEDKRREAEAEKKRYTPLIEQAREEAWSHTRNNVFRAKMTAYAGITHAASLVSGIIAGSGNVAKELGSQAVSAVRSQEKPPRIVFEPLKR